MAQTMLGGSESATQAVAPKTIQPPRHKNPALARPSLTLACSTEDLKGNPKQKECGKCPGKTTGGLWESTDPALNEWLYELAPNGVRCPCGCHE